MPTPTDDLLGQEIRALVDTRHGSIDDAKSDVSRRVARRRLRRRTAICGAATAVVALVAAAAVLSSDPPRDVVAGPGAPGVNRGLIEESLLAIGDIDVTADANGTKVVINFSGSLPDPEVSYLEDIASASGSSILYTVQASSSIQVCDSQHFDFGESFTGSIDVLVPSDWIDLSVVDEQPQTNFTIDGDPARRPGKIVVCGPHEGFVQVSLWGLATDDINDVSVAVGDDPTQLVVNVSG